MQAARVQHVDSSLAEENNRIYELAMRQARQTPVHMPLSDCLPPVYEYNWVEMDGDPMDEFPVSAQFTRYFSY